MNAFAHVPMQTIGPVKIIGHEMNDEVMVPLATYESPLWPSTNRGAKVSRLAGGIRTTILDDKMTRSILLEGENAHDCQQVIISLKNRRSDLQDIVKSSSRYCSFEDMHFQVAGNLLFIRFEFFTGDASGHNMVTKAAEQLQSWILQQYPQMKYISISGNYCIDKKASAVNGILGRGKHVIAEMTVSREVCLDVLKTTPEKIIDLNIKKNLIGSILAGSVRTANAHFANMLLGFYLATGQDAANIVEGSQGIIHAQMKGDDLYISATIPNVIVGTIGSGKDFDFVKKNLAMMGCLEERPAGLNARRLAMIAGATILCGEISLLAAQTNPGELMRTHVAMERSKAVERVDA